MINIKVLGTKEVISKLNRINDAIKVDLQTGLYNSAGYLRDMAIDHLRALARFPGLSADKESITDIDNWSITREAENSIKLACNSAHASAVEIGTFQSGKLGTDGKFHAYELTRNKFGFPVGRQQGMGDNWKSVIKPQMGFHYLEGTMMNPSVGDEMCRIISQHLNTIIEGIGV